MLCNRNISYCYGFAVTPIGIIMSIQNFLPQLSWSKVNLFLQCPRCFYKEQALRMKRPGMDSESFSLNNVIDALWKKEFDVYREQQAPHPIMIQNNIEAIPFKHVLFEGWRDYRTGGVRFVDTVNALELSGVIDDLWVNPDNELIIVDYKATAKHGRVVLNDSNKWLVSNKRQMSFYAFLFKKHGYKVHGTGYFIYSIADNDKPVFDQRLEFNSTLLAYELDDSWIEEVAQDIRACLDQPGAPRQADDCNFCKFNLNLRVH